MPAIKGGAIYNTAAGVVVMFECGIQGNSANVSLSVSDIEMTLDVRAEWCYAPSDRDISVNDCRRVVPSTT